MKAAAPREEPIVTTATRVVPLNKLEVGDRATVCGITAETAVRRRLLEMGFVRGERLKIAKLAPLGDPMELVIKGYHLSLRREEGACILVTKDA